MNEYAEVQHLLPMFFNGREEQIKPGEMISAVSEDDSNFHLLYCPRKPKKFLPRDRGIDVNAKIFHKDSQDILWVHFPWKEFKPHRLALMDTQLYLNTKYLHFWVVDHEGSLISVFCIDRP